MLLWKLESVALFGRGRPRLEGVSLEICAGVTAVVGYSGAGKTSLLNLLVEFERPDRGEVQRGWEPATDRLAKLELRGPGFPSRSLGTREGTRDDRGSQAGAWEPGNRLPVFWVPPGDGLWPHLTVLDHLRTVSPHRGRSPNGSDDGSLIAVLEQFDLAPLHNEYPDRLSQGERTRLAVARALAGEAAVLVLDEPLVHVDSARLGRYWDAVRTHCEQTGTSLVVATHSAETVLREAHFAVCLNQGRVEFSGPVDELYYRPASPQLAAYLGPANWLAEDEAACWLGEDPERTASGNGERGPCYRPEQIAVVPRADGPFVVQSSRFVGSHAEVDLRDERTGKQRRFVHRPAGDGLRVRDRVAIAVRLMVLLGLSLFAGCEGASDKPLPVKGVSHWAMPAAEKRVPAPRSLLAAEGEVYVLDTAGRVLVFDDSGQVRRRWMMPEYDVGKPEGLYLLRDGRLAVADTHYHRVVYFDRQGNVVDMHGELGEGPGQFIYPVAVGQDDDGNVYVCEYGGHDRIQKFTADGRFLLEFGSFGVEPGQFQRPSGMVWHAGNVYVADAINNRIQAFSDAGEFLGILGDNDGSSGLHYPYDIAIGPDEKLYVVEYGAGRVSKFDLTGRLLGRFGSTGWGDDQFATPWGLTVSSELRVYVADTGNRRIVEIEL